ncbi:MAG: glycosyltransferase family 2 protein [Myxococcales bacterium]|nr:glycosyltransferase family 2 protein [Myxococcales bacterium]
MQPFDTSNLGSISAGITMVVEPHKRRYCLITPCRNEAGYLEATLRTVAAQTVEPALWLVVDDGSTDATPRLLQEFADEHAYMRVVNRVDRGRRSVGPGVIEAFYAGLDEISLDDFDYICKLDADLELPSRYFERAMERMESDPYLGNISGKLYERQPNGRVEQTAVGDENALGAAKFYRVECFREIGGFVRAVCWDGIDGHMCRIKGWIAQSVDDPEMRILHLRPMGSSQDNIWVGRRRWGRGKYFMGSAWYYTAAVALYRMLERPRVTGGLGIWVGYLEAVMKSEPRHDDQEYLRYYRRFELESLLTGKRRTLERHNRKVRTRASR